MKKNKPICYELENPCPLCEKNEWLETNLSWRYILLNNHRDSNFFGFDKTHEKICGIKIKGNNICLKCFEILLGLEGYFDSLFFEIHENKFNEAKKIIQNILKDRKTFIKVMKERKEGKYISKEIIEEVQKS